MKQILYITIKISLLLATGLLQSQSFTCKVVDEKTNAVIPYASVQLGKYKGVITNEEGMFVLKESEITKLKDSVFISSMGYKTKGFLIKNITKGIIELTSKTIELSEVFLNTKDYSTEEIIELVKKNIEANYAENLSKKKIFFRQSDIHSIRKMDIGFVKSTIEELDKDLIDSITNTIPKKFEFYREAVGYLYGNNTKHKFYVDKGAVLYDKKADVSMDGLLKKMERIFKDNTKPNSYLKIKSGWFFSTKVQLDSLLGSNGYDRLKIENAENQIFQKQTKDSISKLYTELFFQENSKLDVIRKSNRYKFEKHDYTFIDDEAVYAIKFTPKGRKLFEGVMYVNTQNFAIVRIEFNNIRPLRKFELLGLNYGYNLFRGKMLFNKNASNTYSLKYIELETGSTYGVDRPLKVIEKNKYVKGRRKQNELALNLNLQMKSFHKYELVIYNSEDITSSIFENAIEKPKKK
ncbi:carboxypeptidase-like regulatory domain-containing protein [Tenacibaculum ovolyticum]|uniref:carboxypeptidase-like regulatory domain-containing protein n=1 Tax=Tenacibaculum ovolyticum TaxID=104270 RepID=UPI003BA8A6BF